jgi:putative nucleotidyltransferase with HDIG domain
MNTRREFLIATVAKLAQAVEIRDQYTGQHSQRVTTYAVLLAEQLDLPLEKVEFIRLGTPLHDIGKIGIHDSILRKPGNLTAEEFETMKLHTVKGAAILESIPDLAPILPIVRSHHERWDGKGYPDGLAGDNICQLARIVAVADAFDAMTSDTPYRQGMPAEVALAEVEKEIGRQFDPAAVTAFLQIREKIMRGASACGR